MENELTQEQIEALKFDRHIALTANAGSGKTSVLQQRYVNILLNDETIIEPRNVVAITFTREAAAEILNKISKNIEVQISNETHLARKIKLEKIRAKLNNAPISTIHSFCSSLLRNFPVESNVPPNFGELTEIEKKNIYESSIIQALEEWLDNDNIERNNKVKDMIFTLGRSNVENLIKYLLEKREKFDWLKNYYMTNGVGDFIIKRNEIILNKSIPRIIPSIEKIIELIDLLLIRNPEKFSNLILLRNRISFIISELENVQKISNNAENFIKEIYEVLKELNDTSVLKSNFEINLTTAKKNLEQSEIENFNKNFKPLPDFYLLCKAYEFNEYDKKLFKYAKYIVELASDVIDNINDEKDVLSALDYDDQLIKTSELLNNDYVVEKIRRKIKYLMIDEFQDTNDLQYGIVKKLIPELNGKDIKNNLNFYIVGDEKQSIYGFRNADVRVFEKAKWDIAETNKRIYNNIISNAPYEDKIIHLNPPLIKGENVGILNLTITFRLAPVPAAFVNKVCGRIFEKAESEFDVNYSPLVCSNKVEEIINNDDINKEIDLSDKNYGNVTFLISDYSNFDKENKSSHGYLQNKEENGFISEAKSLALYIKNLANKYGKKWNDFGILARNRSGFDELISEFQEQSIPYILHAGKGFYKSQEVVDICTILSFLHNPNDNKAITASLRSPYFHIDDDFIFEISTVKPVNSFWDKFKIYCSELEIKIKNNKNINNDEQNCLRAIKILSELTQRAVRISIPQLIHKINDLCSWNSLISGLPSENQMKANVNKMIQIAREFEKKGFKNLFDFVEQVKGTISADLTESEAVFLSDDDAVNIMTIHASKGLQFDTVCLYNSADYYSKIPQFLINDDIGLTFKMNIKEVGSDILKNMTTPSHFLALESQYKAEKAESKRLLYVALTRAKENLIISSTINKKGQTGFDKSYFKMILNSLIDKFEINNNPKEFIINDTLKCYHKDKFYDLRIKYPVKFLFNYSDKIPSGTKSKNTFSSEPIKLCNEIVSQSDNEIFSATKLITFNDDNDEYIMRYIFGLPSSEDYDFNSVHNLEIIKEDDITGSFAGTLIHTVLERIKEWLKSDGNIDEKILNNTIDFVCNKANKIITKELTDRISNECKAIAKTVLIKLYSKSIQNSIAEKTLQLVYKNDILLVKTDLLLKNESGEWEIWDWKTNRIDSAGKKSELINYYELQMKIYTYFLMKLYPEQKNFRARLLFTRLAKNFVNPINSTIINNEIKDDWIYTFKWTETDLGAIEKEILKNVDEIKNHHY